MEYQICFFQSTDSRPIGIGEITSIPTAPAIADAYYRLTGEREFSLPLKNTPYAPKK